MSHILIHNGRLLDVVNQRILDNRCVLIDEHHISRIDAAEALTASSSARHVFDARGGLIMPGLIDTHVQLCTVRKPAATVAGDLRAPETLKVLYGATHARQTLEAGFTTVRDMGQGDNLALKEAIRHGIVKGPRIVACGWMGVTSGHDERMGAGRRFNDVGVDGPWAIRKKVRELVGQGVDVINTDVTSGGYQSHPFTRFWEERPTYTMEELEALVDEAHLAGRKTAARGFVNATGTKNAILAGIDTLEHGLVLDREDAREMVARGMTYVPTLAMTHRTRDVGGAEPDRLFHIGPEDAERLLETQLNSFRIAREEGVAIAMGSGARQALGHGENASEITLRIKAGMSTMEALVSATIVSARALGIDALVGSLEGGKRADVLVVDPDPLDDAAVLTRPESFKLIIKDGEIVRRRL